MASSSEGDESSDLDTVSDSNQDKEDDDITFYHVEPPSKKRSHDIAFYREETPAKKINEDNEEPPVTRNKPEVTVLNNTYSKTAMNMMKIMGYQENKGLGREGQGRLEPIEASKQDGRRGLGLRLEDLSKAAIQWDPKLESNPFEKEVMNWLKNDSNDFDYISIDYLSDLVVRGPKKLEISDETKFCDSKILANVLSSKSAFDKLDSNDMRRATSRSNPYETIRGSIYLNRAAVKMANIDYLCDFMFTQPVDKNNKPIIKDDDLLYFADLCAGPGGFTEYILSKKGWEAKGFGFTLRGENDFKLDNFLAASPETFDPYYGIKDDGNIFDPVNQESFFEYVLKQTNDGVHFVMADGGFSVEGQENIQEILSKQLYLCQCLVALSILREKGHFVCKLFDLFTPFSVGLVYLMYKCFEEICICKPKTSRPANSERYLICKRKKSNTDTIRRHLFNINRELWDNTNSNKDITELVSCSHLFENKMFVDYVTESNNRLGENQVIGLIKIAAYVKDTNLKETKQAEVRKYCLEMWQLPDRMRTRQPAEVISTENLLSQLLCDWGNEKDMFVKQPTELQKVTDLEKHIHSVFDWYFVPIGRQDNVSNVQTYFLCKGKGNIFQCTSGGKWEHVNLNLELSPKTLIYGEIVTELIGEGKGQNKVNALHIIDGIALGGKDIRRMPLDKRLKMCSKYALALNKPARAQEGGRPLMAPIRVKSIIPLQDLNKFFYEMSMYKLKDGSSRLGYKIQADDETQQRFFVPGALLLIRLTVSPYARHFSKTHQKLYFFDIQTKASFFENNLSCNPYASFRWTFNTRLQWKWYNVNQVEEVEPDDRMNNLLYRFDIQQFLNRLK